MRKREWFWGERGGRFAAFVRAVWEVMKWIKRGDEEEKGNVESHVAVDFVSLPYPGTRMMLAAADYREKGTVDIGLEIERREMEILIFVEKEEAADEEEVKESETPAENEEKGIENFVEKGERETSSRGVGETNLENELGRRTPSRKVTADAFWAVSARSDLGLEAGRVF